MTFKEGQTCIERLKRIIDSYLAEPVTFRSKKDTYMYYVIANASIFPREALQQLSFSHVSPARSHSDTVHHGFLVQWNCTSKVLFVSDPPQFKKIHSEFSLRNSRDIQIEIRIRLEESFRGLDRNNDVVAAYKEGLGLAVFVLNSGFRSGFFCLPFIFPAPPLPVEKAILKRKNVSFEEE